METLNNAKILVLMLNMLISVLMAILVGFM